MITCAEFQEVLADLDRPGALTAEVREQAFAHAEGCGDCGQLLKEAESLDGELGRLREREAYAQAPARMEAQLLRAFREQKVATARESTRRYAAMIGIAATVLLVLGFWMNRRTNKAAALPDLTVKNPLVAVQPKAASNTGRPAGIAHVNTGIGVAPSDAAVAANTGDTNATDKVAEADSAAAFTPLPDADDPAPLDDGAVVRVEMPRAALASFGLPVEAMEGGGTVRADLIVSEDGTPQAIRLVSQDDESAAAQR